MTPRDVAELLARFDAAWPGSDITPQRATVWAEQLANVDAGYGEAAANALIGESKFFPSIAEFRGRASDFRRRDDMAGEPLALEEGDMPAEAVKANLVRLRRMLADMPKRAS